MGRRKGHSRIRRLVEDLRAYQPERVYLFGSWARGEEDDLSSVGRTPAKAVSAPTLPDADGTEPSQVIKVNLRDLEAGEFSKNVELHDGDTIFVPRAEIICLFGEVKNPGSYPIQRNTTVLQALSLVGGATQFAALNRIKIIRIVGGERKEIKVKLTDLVKPGDTIMVPERFF